MIVCVIVARRSSRAGGASSLLVPTLYLTAFVWENLLIQQPSVTRDTSSSARC